MWKIKEISFNRIQDGLFRGCSRMGEGAFWPHLHKIRHTNPAMMKLGTVIPYLRKFQKMHKSRDTPLGFCWHQHFLLEISKFCYIKKSTHRLDFDTKFQFFLTFLESLVIVLRNMVTILMMSANKTTPGLHKIRLFWNKNYDVIIFVHDVTNKILSQIIL